MEKRWGENEDSDWEDLNLDLFALALFEPGLDDVHLVQLAGEQDLLGDEVGVLVVLLDELDGLLPEATTVRATFHRYVIDANRDPSGESLYPGQNTTGLVPLQPNWKVMSGVPALALSRSFQVNVLGSIMPMPLWP